MLTNPRRAVLLLMPDAVHANAPTAAAAAGMPLSLPLGSTGLSSSQMLTFLPVLNGRYLYLIMCLICRFIVTVNSSNQYSSRMGQNTGTSNMVNSVIASPIPIDFIDDHLQQNSPQSFAVTFTLSQMQDQCGPGCCCKWPNHHSDCLGGFACCTATCASLTRT